MQLYQSPHGPLAAIMLIFYFYFFVDFFVFFLLMLQNPREADAMTKVQAELDETKIVLVSLMKKMNILVYMLRMESVLFFIM